MRVISEQGFACCRTSFQRVLGAYPQPRTLVLAVAAALGASIAAPLHADDETIEMVLQINDDRMEARIVEQSEGWLTRRNSLPLTREATGIELVHDWIESQEDHEPQQENAAFMVGMASTVSEVDATALVIQDVDQENHIERDLMVVQSQAGWTSLENTGHAVAGDDGLRLISRARTLQTQGAGQVNVAELEAQAEAGENSLSAGIQSSLQRNTLRQHRVVSESTVGRSRLVNKGRITAGGAGLRADHSASRVQVFDTDQVNTSGQDFVGTGTEITGDGSGVILGDVSVEQANELGQTHVAADSRLGELAIENHGDITSGDHGVAAILTTPDTQIMDAIQENTWQGTAELSAPSGEVDDSGSTGTPGGLALSTRYVEQSSEASQTDIATATSVGHGRIHNTGSVSAEGYGLALEVDASRVQVQQVEQINDVTGDASSVAGSGGDGGAGDPDTGADGGAGGNALAELRLNQSNELAQTLVLTDSRIGQAEVRNAGSVQAGGGGIVARVSTDIVQVQEGEQANQAMDAFDATAGDAGAGGAGDVDGGAGADGGDGGDGGDTLAELIWSQSNEAGQIVLLSHSRLAEVEVENSGRVFAGGRGITAESGVSLVQVQILDQTNSAEVETRLVGGDGGEGGIGSDGNDGDGGAGGSAEYHHRLGQENESEQILLISGGSLASTKVSNHGDIRAGGDGIVARANAEVAQKEHVNQANTDEMQEAGDGAGGEPDGEAINDISVDQSNHRAGIMVIDAVEVARVRVEHHGEIDADGRGIVAHSSISGVSDSATAVSVLSSGHIRAGQQAIHAISDGGSARDIEVRITDGSVIGGPGYYGLQLEGSGSNTVWNDGVLTSMSRRAVLGGDGDDTIYNTGLLAGDVDLGTGSNALFNQEAGRFESEAIVDLNGGTLENRGWLNPGGTNRIVTTQVAGDWTNTATGRYQVSLDMVSGDSDFLDISGTASLNGEVVPRILVPDDSGSFTIAAATGGVTDEGMNVQDTLFVDYKLDFSSASELGLSAEIDIPETVTGLNSNQQSVHGVIEGLWATGSTGDLDTVFGALLSVSDVAELAQAYEQLSPEPHMNSAASATHAAGVFASDLLSCSVDSGAHVHVRQGECAWVRLGRRNLDQDSTSRQAGFEENSISVSTGVQRALANDWHLGGGVGFERGDVQSDSGAQTEVDRMHAGAVLKYAPGPWMVSGSVSGGYGWHDSTRVVDFTGEPSELTADYRVRHLGIDLHAQYEIDLGGSYLKPYAGLGYRQVRLGGFSESGGPEALDVDSERDRAGSIALGTRWGTEFETGNDTLVRPYLSAGATRYTSDETQLTASFQGGGDSFRISRSRDRTVADMGAGLEILAGDSGSVRVDYRGRFSNNMTDHAIGMRVQIPF